MIIEQAVIEYLNGKLNDVPAYGSEPENPEPANFELTERPQFVVVQKTGSGESNRLRSATIAVQSYAGSLAQAAVINETVIEAMRDIVELDDVTACRLNSDYEFSRESTKQPRYQAVFDIYYY